MLVERNIGLGYDSSESTFRAALFELLFNSLRSFTVSIPLDEQHLLDPARSVECVARVQTHEDHDR